MHEQISTQDRIREKMLTQKEADNLLEMEKYCSDSSKHSFPISGGELRILLKSKDRHEEFILDISRSKFELSKNKFQLRARQSIVLVRLDIGGPPHKNPDYKKIPAPHIHVYKEGFDDGWAEPFVFDISDLQGLLDHFFEFCNIRKKPNILFDL